MKNIIFMFIGAGGLAGIAFLFTQIFDKKSAVRSAVHKVTQSNIIDKIKDISSDQNNIKIKVDKYDEMSEASKKKIDDIKKEAETKIQIVKQNESNISTSQQTINDLWNDI